MGLIRQGILGGFRKKTGSVVGAYWRTLDTIRALPRVSGKAPTQEQLNQQLKFKLVTSTLGKISPLIDVGYKGVAGVSTPMNIAVRHHLKEAITGIEPNFTFDYTKLQFSTGKLELPNSMTVTESAAGLVFSWTGYLTDDKYINATDKLTILIYSAAKNKFFKEVGMATRIDETHTLVLPLTYVGDEVHIYISFSSVKNKSLVSDTMYLGLLPLSL